MPFAEDQDNPLYGELYVLLSSLDGSNYPRMVEITTIGRYDSKYLSLPAMKLAVREGLVTVSSFSQGNTWILRFTEAGMQFRQDYNQAIAEFLDGEADAAARAQ
jgi:hypothetical protein